MRLSILSITLLLFTTLFISCKDEQSYLIKGELTGLKSSEIIFVTPSSDQLKTDTVYLNQNTFQYQASSDMLQPVMLYLENGSVWLTVWAQNGLEINISGDVNHPKLLNVTGGEMNDLLTQFKNDNQELIKEQINLFKNGNGNTIRAIEINNEMEANVEAFLNSHPNSLASLVLIQDYILQDIQSADLRKCLEITADLKEEALYKKLETICCQLEKTQIGATAPDFSFINLKGDTLTLEKMKGKYLLMTFASSWTEQSKEALDEWAEIRKEIPAKELEILTVFLDEDSTSQAALAKETKVDWHQVVDKDGLSSQTIDSFNIRTIPQAYLLDKEGVIVAHDVPCDSIIALLKETR